MYPRTIFSLFQVHQTLNFLRVVGTLILRCKIKVASPFLGMGKKWDSVGICIGLAWDLEAINDYNMVLCPMCLSVFMQKNTSFIKIKTKKMCYFQILFISLPCHYVFAFGSSQPNISQKHIW